MDKLPDNRKSGFWKLTWTQVMMRLLLWAVVVFINEKGWVNPHDPHFVFVDFKMEKVDITGVLDWFWAKQMEKDRIADLIAKEKKDEIDRNVTLL